MAFTTLESLERDANRYCDERDRALYRAEQAEDKVIELRELVAQACAIAIAALSMGEGSYSFTDEAIAGIMAIGIDRIKNNAADPRCPTRPGHER